MMLDGDIGFSKPGPVRVTASDQLGFSWKQRKSAIRLLILHAFLQVYREKGTNRFQDAV